MPQTWPDMDTLIQIREFRKIHGNSSIRWFCKKTHVKFHRVYEDSWFSNWGCFSDFWWILFINFGHSVWINHQFSQVRGIDGIQIRHISTFLEPIIEDSPRKFPNISIGKKCIFLWFAIFCHKVLLLCGSVGACYLGPIHRRSRCCSSHEILWIFTNFDAFLWDAVE